MHAQIFLREVREVLSSHRTEENKADMLSHLFTEGRAEDLLLKELLGSISPNEALNSIYDYIMDLPDDERMEYIENFPLQELCDVVKSFDPEDVVKLGILILEE